MKTLDHFPKDKICLMCGTSEDKPCTLIEIDNTGVETCEATPVHVECATNGDLRYNREVNIFYKKGKEK